MTCANSPSARCAVTMCTGLPADALKATNARALTFYVVCQERDLSGALGTSADWVISGGIVCECPLRTGVYEICVLCGNAKMT